MSEVYPVIPAQALHSQDVVIPVGRHYSLQTVSVPSLIAAAVGTLVEAERHGVSLFAAVNFDHLNGAARSTKFGHSPRSVRDSGVKVRMIASTPHAEGPHPEIAGAGQLLAELRLVGLLLAWPNLLSHSDIARRSQVRRRRHAAARGEAGSPSDEPVCRHFTRASNRLLTRVLALVRHRSWRAAAVGVYDREPSARNCTSVRVPACRGRRYVLATVHIRDSGEEQGRKGWDIQVCAGAAGFRHGDRQWRGECWQPLRRSASHARLEHDPGDHHPRRRRRGNRAVGDRATESRRIAPRDDHRRGLLHGSAMLGDPGGIGRLSEGVTAADVKAHREQDGRSRSDPLRALY